MGNGRLGVHCVRNEEKGMMGREGERGEEMKCKRRGRKCCKGFVMGIA